eukprot:COSAG02_NODE_1458_length_12476_cov_6.772841_15_plen_84_part_00
MLRETRTPLKPSSGRSPSTENINLEKLTLTHKFKPAAVWLPPLRTATSRSLLIRTSAGTARRHKLRLAGYRRHTVFSRKPYRL